VNTKQRFSERGVLGKANLFSIVAAVALVGVIVAMGAFTLWHMRSDDRAVTEMVDAQRMSVAYTRASTEADRAELFVVLGFATGNPEYVERQIEARDAMNAALLDISRSARPEDRQFTEWAQRYFTPLSETFVRLSETPNIPLEEVMAEYGVGYVALFESVKAGDIGEGIAENLVDPDAVGRNPLLYGNPVTTIMRIKAEERADSAAAALLSTEQNERVARVVAPALFAGGILMVIVLLVITIHFGRQQARTVAENNQLRRLSSTDPLTMLGNRRGFEEAIKRAGDDTSAGTVSLLMMDLDEFKIVNDTFGHARGDAVLVRFANLLTKIAPPGVSRFRIGGDEFALIAHGIQPAEALRLAETIRLTAFRSLGDGVTVSLGVATLEAGVRDVSVLGQQADAALYEAKMHGRNLSVLYEERGRANPVFSAAKLQGVRLLLEEGRIEAAFQPIWHIHNERVLGYEGLSRPHADYQLSGPQEAFDIAEQFGHAAELDALCRHHILAAVHELPADSRVFINISPYTLTHSTFSPLMLIRELQAASVDKSRIVFEVTERSTVPAEVIYQAVSQLRDHGIAVALDDVGSGHNGLELLSKVPFDYVKIDRSLMLSASASTTGRAALIAILAFASESGAVVIAEGIEDVGMFEMVREVASSMALKGNPGLIHGVQGYLFGRPGPASRIPTEFRLDAVA
jgi:diguanylate cyclase (GGDEF)-like protein